MLWGDGIPWGDGAAAAVRSQAMTDLARRIARAHNRQLPPLEFARAGGSIVVAGVRFPIRAHRVTRAEVRAYLEAYQGTGADRSVFELYGSTPRKPIEEDVDAGDR